MSGTTRAPGYAEKRRTAVKKPSNRSVNPDIRWAGIVELAALCSEGVRLEILLALASGPLEVGPLAVRVGRDSASVSHHLKPLYEAGVLKRVKHGAWATYSFNPEIVEVEVREETLVFTFRPVGELVVQCRLPRGAP